MTTGYIQTLQALDVIYDEYGKSPHFIEQATVLYNQGILYVWPQHLAQVALTDNWMLHSLGYADSLLEKVGLTNVPMLFGAYQSIDYRRALKRGYGICSQNALGLVSLLGDRYNIRADIIALEGHVLVEANGYLLDPSVGLSMPFDLQEAERLEPESGGVSAFYQQHFSGDEVMITYDMNGEIENETLLAGLGQYFDSEGNQRIHGVKDYRPKIYWFERTSDWLKWIIPVLVMFTGIWGLWFTRGNTTKNMRE